MDVKDDKCVFVIFKILDGHCDVSVRTNTIPSKLEMPRLSKPGDFKRHANTIFLKGRRHFVLQFFWFAAPQEWFVQELREFMETTKRLKNISLVCSNYISILCFEFAQANAAIKTLRVQGSPDFAHMQRVFSFDELRANTGLKTLDVSSSNLGIANLTNLLTVLMHENRSVKNLSVSENALHKGHAKQLIRLVSTSTVLRRLRMEETGVATKYARRIIEQIRICDRLKEFYISNDIDCFESLVKLVTRVKNLRCLSVNGMLDTSDNYDKFTEILKTSNESVTTFICTQDQFTNPSLRNVLENKHLKRVYLPALALSLVKINNLRRANENGRIVFLGDHQPGLFSQVSNRNLHNAAARKTLLASLFF